MADHGCAWPFVVGQCLWTHAIRPLSVTYSAAAAAVYAYGSI